MPSKTKAEKSRQTQMLTEDYIREHPDSLHGEDLQKDKDMNETRFKIRAHGISDGHHDHELYEIWAYCVLRNSVNHGGQHTLCHHR